MLRQMAGATARPTSSRDRDRSAPPELQLRAGGGQFSIPTFRQVKKSFHNLVVTLLCGFVTLVVLRGTAGFGDLYPSSAVATTDQKVIEEVERILNEIRSDSKPNGTIFADQSSNTLALFSYGNYSLGPKISNWDEQRRQWLNEHPGFPSHATDGKPRVLLVTGSPPSPCENPSGDHYLLKSIKNKIDYTRIHGMEIVYNMAFLDQEMSGFWSKLPLIRSLMLSHPEVEWIWWMDSDALFTDMAFEIPFERYKDHNLIIHGFQDLLDKHSWFALNTGCFLMRNSQWSLDLLDAWAPMGPKGPVRDAAGKILTAFFEGRPDFEADDQSTLIYLMITKQRQWGDKVYVENSYYLHGYWTKFVDHYEELMEQNHPGFGDDKWPFVTHFVGCKPCGKFGDYPIERCLKSMERAFNFGDNQVLRLYGFVHGELDKTAGVKRIREQSANPLEDLEKLRPEDKIEIGL